MTLKTDVAILRPVPAEPLFRFCQSLLGDPETMDTVRYSAGDPYSWSKAVLHDNHTIENVVGQGLAAILRVEFGADGPLRADDEEVLPAGSVMRVSFDTGGPDSDDIHAYLVTCLSLYLDERSAGWTWKMEYSGEWINGRLTELGDPILGMAAIKEFQNER